MRFAGQTIIVTGAGQGIGKQVALAFGREGGNIVLAARSRDKLEAVAADLRAQGTRPLVVPTDVAVEDDVARMVASTLAAYGGVDVLIANSGIGGPTALCRDVSDADWQQTLGVNLSGAFYCAKHVSRSMIEARRGVIINIVSIAGRIGFGMRAPYAASKWGQLGLSHALAAELGPHGIRVNAVLPGAVEGTRLDDVHAHRAHATGGKFDDIRGRIIADTPLKRLVSEQEVAETVLFLASPAASGITGQALNVCGGLRMQ